MITLITPTGDRSIAFKLCIEYIKHQIIKEPIQWIIIDDGQSDSTFNIYKNSDIRNLFLIEYIRRNSYDQGVLSLAANLLEALPYIKGDKIFIIEDDDWYSPLYLQDGFTKLQEYQATGPIWQCYYNLEQLTYKVMKNKGSSMCSTCFRIELLPLFRKACLRGYETAFKGIDYLFWKSLEAAGKHIFIDEKTNYLCVGMKCLPGRKGIGIGHIGKRFYPDQKAKKLKEWVGKKWAEVYLEIRHDMLGH